MSKNAESNNKASQTKQMASPTDPTDNPAYQLLDIPPATEFGSPNVYNYWRPRPSRPLFSPSYYGPDDMFHYAMPPMSPEYDDMDVIPGSAYASPHGTIVLRLNHRTKVELTVDQAIRIVSYKNMIVLAMNASGSACALIHPNGRVYQYNTRVEIMAIDSKGYNKYAKMWHKGVSFTSDSCALVYLVDTAGTRTTTDTFTDLTLDFSLEVFFSESRHGPALVNDAVNAIQSAEYWVGDDGVENWSINDVKVSQAPDGLIRVSRNSNKNHLRTSAANGTASISTPFVHCTASMGTSSHLFVRRGERRMHFDGSSFIVRNAGHSAGFDDKAQLKVF